MRCAARGPRGVTGAPRGTHSPPPALGSARPRRAFARTPFLQLLYYDAVKSRPLVEAAVGTAFTITFIVVRLVSAPFFLYALYLSRHALVVLPFEGVWGRCFVAAQLASLPLPLLVNVFWGRLVVVGYWTKLRKTLGAATPRAKTE